MATISTANFTGVIDVAAKAITDLLTSFVTNPATTAPTIATITAGRNGATNSLQARLAGLSDFTQETALEPGANTSIANAISLMAGNTANNTIYAQFTSLMNALDLHVNGVNTFMTSNSLMAHPNFAATFNYFVNNATALGLRGSANAPTLLAAANIFPAAVVTPMATINVTGAAAGTFVAGTAINTTANGAVPLSIYNNSTGASAAATVLSVTYTGADGAAHTVGKTITAGMATGIGAAVTLGVSGTAVTNITVTSAGTNTESYIVFAPLLRTVAYTS